MSTEWVYLTEPRENVSSWYDDDGNELPRLLEVGRLLRLADGSVLLVGDCNRNGGGCDCCGGHSSPVVAYSDSLRAALAEAVK
jgi:hypothetical protein